MPDQPISGLAAAGTLHTDDLLVDVDVHDVSMATTGTNKKLTFGQLTASFTGDVTFSGWFASIAAGAVSEDQMSLSDVTTLNASTARHGFVPKLPNDPTQFLNGAGGFSVPAGSGGGSGTVTQIIAGTGLTGGTITTSGTIALASPVVVANGGTGATTLTPYAVICGGITSTSLVQSVASVGTSGQVLMSNGPAALPTFQTMAGGGSVSNVSVVTANGFGGTVANATTLPAITISSSVIGLLKGNGTAVSAATAGTDYLNANQTITLTGDTTGSGTTAITTATTKIGGKAVTLGGSLAFSGAFTTTITVTGNTTVTLPTTGTLVTTTVTTLASLSLPAGQVTGLAASATTDTTNASNISSGTLNGARLPAPSSGVLGGTFSSAVVPKNYLTGISLTGTPTLARPQISDLQNVSASVLVGNPTGSAAVPSEITLGTNLSFAGTVLNATGGGGGGDSLGLISAFASRNLIM